MRRAFRAPTLAEVGMEGETEAARLEAQDLLLQISLAAAGQAARAERERDSEREAARVDPLTGVLRATARTIAEALPGEGIVGRYGGEEFLVVLRDHSLEEAMEVAEDVRRTVERRSVDAGEATLRVTVSGGLCWIAPDRAVSPEDAFRETDASLYEAKRSGRNRVRCVVLAAGGVATRQADRREPLPSEPA